MKPLRCPNCGGKDVRPSWPAGMKDVLARWFSFSPFRCRACTHRFYRHHATLDQPPAPPPAV